MKNEANKIGGQHFDRLPDRCPICLKGVMPIRVGENPAAPALDRPRGELALLCPRDECHRLFVARYDYVKSDMRYSFREAVPRSFEPPTIPDEIREVSPAFVEIFEQSTQAQVLGLHQIAGVGFRKALEFLVKDFCVREHPNDEGEIKRTLLGPVIAKWVDDPKTKDCATRAAWLGNDETHYVRRWEDRDINDLKTLIRLTQMWIEATVLTAKFQVDMRVGK